MFSGGVRGFILTGEDQLVVRLLGAVAGFGDYLARGNPDQSLQFLQQLHVLGQEIAHNVAEVPAVLLRKNTADAPRDDGCRSSCFRCHAAGILGFADASAPLVATHFAPGDWSPQPLPFPIASSP